MSTNSFGMAPKKYEQADEIFNQAQEIFVEARWRAYFGYLKALVSHRRSMLTLSKRLAGKVVRGQHVQGFCSIEIRRIVGTESRVNDFDLNFNPLNDRVHDRWVSIAVISLNGTGLPAVDLIRVGDEYYVRDGHHRISVARALGFQFVDAQVTVLEI